MVIESNYMGNAALAYFLDKAQDAPGTYIVEPYQNGREHGWCIRKGIRQVCFSGFRRSDEFVVYAGEVHEFSMQGNVPSQEVYEQRYHYPYEAASHVADFVISFLK